MLDTSIQHYYIQSVLGKGGMATVYLAEDRKFKSLVALKILNKEYVHNDHIRKRFLEEARNMFRMSHPNIVKVTDLIDQDDVVAFAMEHIEGETLREHIDGKGKLTNAEITALFKQMLQALAYVHKQQLIHRDIKPSNFMLDKEGNIKLMDFGIAKNTDASSAEYTQTGTGVIMGTPMYMSPEQVKATKEVGFTSDIYSMGVLLWQMVTGTKPFDSEALSIPEIQYAILKEPLSLTNTSWDSVIQKATAKDPAQRYASMGEWWREFTRNTQESNREDKSQAKTSPIEEPTIITQAVEEWQNQQVPKKRTWRWYAGIGGALVLAVGLLWFFFLRSKLGTYNGIEYVEIGDQQWMTKNLDVSTFRNGDPIPQAATDEEWIRAGENKEPAWCYYNNNPLYGKKYGKLYNWFAVNDRRGLAPEGWHVPSDVECTTLTDFLGGEKKAGKKMKSNTGWAKNNNGTNESGFAGLPGGFRVIDGSFDYIGEVGVWWSSSQDGSSSAWNRFLLGGYDLVDRSSLNMGDGCSVRCLRD
jgi:uncharacterized protein (TIGR02145 family)